MSPYPVSPALAQETKKTKTPKTEPSMLRPTAWPWPGCAGAWGAINSSSSGGNRWIPGSGSPASIPADPRELIGTVAAAGPAPDRCRLGGRLGGLPRVGRLPRGGTGRSYDKARSRTAPPQTGTWRPGKPWRPRAELERGRGRDAAEAIDFCEYYARQVLEIVPGPSP